MTANLARLALAALVPVLVAGCASTPESFPYEQKYYLYVAPGEKHVAPGEKVVEEYGKDRVREAFKHALDRKPGKPVVLFVHGRGIEPHKSLVGGTMVEGRAVHKLRDTYDLPVVLFSWDSAYGGTVFDRCRPLKNAVPAAGRLKTVFDALSSWSTDAGRPKIVLLVHSMGNIVLENYILTNHEIPQGLFENIVLSSADADNEGHDVWVQKLKQSGAPVYITVNPGDDTLWWSRSCRFWSAAPLGMNPGNAKVKGVHYEPFNTDGHEIFHPYKEFYGTVLNGGAWPKKPAPP